ncbi:DNA glycosylase [Kockovaella imperatae]|uniref:DNA glycosylase n=1 Tax=Kockovaella imperatae TaxID=4999 RepID=A0A1Y1UE12_9TREE|nr:DNA glycosylase [Kockovaella imperatae]ORX36281.1 DNA glycosylase [Kockovaella imperatae]
MVRASTRSISKRTAVNASPSSPVLGKRSAPSSPIPKSIKDEPDTVKDEPLTSVKDETVSPSKDTLASRKRHKHTKSIELEPFPTFHRPLPDECALAHRILSSLHGARKRPANIVAPTNRAGCGDSPSVLDALVRTILSQNTSDSNSSRAMMSMNEAYGGALKWKEIVEGGQPKLQEAIKCGGLSVVKSKVIIKILEQVYEKYGHYSLDHLHKASTEDAMEELLSFDGVGPKTASCVLLFCLCRDDFAVDTHVFRITKLLGWTPAKANREQTYHHLNRRIPDEHKYGLHILIVTHGKRCDECKAGGRAAGKCELRKAFRDQAPKGLKQEIKEEMEDEDDVKDQVKEED